MHVEVHVNADELHGFYWKIRRADMKLYGICSISTCTVCPIDR